MGFIHLTRDALKAKTHKFLTQLNNFCAQSSLI